MPQLSPAHIISLVLRSSITSNSQKGTEQRDALFARLFGLMSVIDSGLLLRPTASLEDFKLTLGELWGLGEKKAWIREPSWWAAIRGIRALLSAQGQEVAWKEQAIQAVVDRVYGKAAAGGGVGAMPWTQEKVALTLLLQSHRPDFDWKSLLAPAFKNGDVLAATNLHTLSRILKETSEPESSRAPSGEPVSRSVPAGTWKPQLHFIWDVLFGAYFPSSASDTANILGTSIHGDKASFQEFWQAVVDDGLFSPTSTPQRKFWGFEVVDKALHTATKDELPMIFTKNFMRTWMNQLSGQDKYLHKAAVQVAKTLQTVTKANPLIGFPLLSQLIGQHGSQQFDRLTKTKTVEGIMGSLDVEGVRNYLSYLIKSFEADSDETQRLWSIDQLASLLKNANVPKDDTTIWTVLQLLVLYGFFTVRKSNPKSACTTLKTANVLVVSDKITESCRSRFFSSIIELTISTRTTTGGKDQKSTKQSLAADESGKLWLTRSLELLHTLEADKKHVTPVTDVDEEIQLARKEAAGTLKTLQKSASLQEDVEQGLRILLTFALLKTYDDDVKAYEILDDVDKCARAMAQPSASSSQKAADGDLPPVDLLVDALVAYLDQASSDLKSLAGHVFGLISSQASETTVEHLIAQLEQIGGGEDSDEEMDDDEEDDDEDQESEDESSDDADVDDDADAAVDPELRKRLAEALQVSGMADEEIDGDEDESSEGDESDDESVTMDDDAMLALDDKLAAIFKSQTTGKKQNQASIVENMHFKSRVLDLIEIYLRKQASNALAFRFIPPLIRLAQMTGPEEKSVATKSANVLTRRFEKSDSVPAVTDVAAVSEILDEIHRIARSAPNKEIAKLCSQCSIAVAKSLAHSQQSNTVVAAYQTSLKDYMTKKTSKLAPSFINDLLARQPVQAWAIRGDLVRYAGGEAVNAFHIEEALNMLAALSKQLAALSKTVEADEINAFIVDCQKVIYDSLEKVADGSLSWNANRVKEAIKTALQVARHSSAVLDTPEAIAEAWDVERLRKLQASLEQAASVKNTPSVFTLLSQLALAVDPEAKKAQAARKQEKQQAKKRKADDVSEVTKPNGKAEKVEGETKAKKVKKMKKAGGASK